MKTAMKKLFSLVLVAVLLVGAMPLQAFASEVTLSYPLTLEAGKTYSVDEIAKQYYSGTSTNYWVQNGNVRGETFEAREDITYTLYVVEVDSTPVTPTVCDKCAGSHATENCDKVYCDECEAYTDHGNDAHCNVCHEFKNDCPVTCPGNDNYVAPAPAKATVLIRAKAPSDAGYPDGGDFKVDAGTYSVNEIFGKANFTREHNGYCVTGTGIEGQRNQGEDIVIAAGGEYILWIELKEAAQPTPDPEPTPDPNVCTECGAEAINGMCTGCYLDMGDCTCGQTTAPEQLKHPTTLTLDYNYRGAKNGHMKVEKGAKLIDIIATIPAPTRDGHLFSHWTMDAAGEDTIDTERVTDKGVVIYAQWDDDLALGGKITIRVNLNYDRKMGESLTNIKKGTRMGDVLDYVTEPTRWQHKFVGWYWDRDCKDPVKDSDKVYKNDEIFAKWERRRTNNEIMLKIYLNGNTKSVAKIVDMYEYSKDGKISLDEVKVAVKQYYTSKNSKGLSYDGLFEADDWSDYVRNHKRNHGEKGIYVNKDGDTTIYVMVHNAKVRTSSSSATADASNPKTGDMIFTAVTVMGASAACLAALFFLNKKRAY